MLKYIEYKFQHKKRVSRIHNFPLCRCNEPEQVLEALFVFWRMKNEIR